LPNDDACSPRVARAGFAAGAGPSAGRASVDPNSRAAPAATALLRGLEPSLSVQVFDGRQTWDMEPAGWQVTVNRQEVAGHIDLVDVTMWFASAWDGAGWDQATWGF